MKPTRIENKFADLKTRDEKGFIAYITAGDPDLAATEDAVLCLEDAGVDIIELGIPFSDPLADGRVNQQSANRALESGTTIHKVFASVARLREKTQVPLMCYTYMNPIYSLGSEAVIRSAAQAGIDGLLILDLPFEESDATETLMCKYGLNNIRLITPTSSDERIANIVRSATGFIYCVSREGVTGMQKSLNAGAADVVTRTRAHTKLPVALGFGISTPQHARAAAEAADAIVVGSAIVDRFHQAPNHHKGHLAAARWVGTLVKAAKEA